LGRVAKYLPLVPGHERQRVGRVAADGVGQRLGGGDRGQVGRQGQVRWCPDADASEGGGQGAL